MRIRRSVRAFLRFPKNDPCSKPFEYQSELGPEEGRDSTEMIYITPVRSNRSASSGVPEPRPFFSVHQELCRNMTSSLVTEDVIIGDAPSLALLFEESSDSMKVPHLLSEEPHHTVWIAPPSQDHKQDPICRISVASSDKEIFVFHVHRSIIIRSPLLKAEFAHQCIEPGDDYVALYNVDEELFTMLLHWLYTGECDAARALTENDFWQLWKFGNRFEVQEFCECLINQRAEAVMTR